MSSKKKNWVENLSSKYFQGQLENLVTVSVRIERVEEKNYLEKQGKIVKNVFF
jgi:hypothetical protein